MIAMKRNSLYWPRTLRQMHLLTRCGVGTVFTGSVDRRASGALIRIGDACLLQGPLVVEHDETHLTSGQQTIPRHHSPQELRRRVSRFRITTSGDLQPPD